MTKTANEKDQSDKKTDDSQQVTKDEPKAALRKPQGKVFSQRGHEVRK